MSGNSGSSWSTVVLAVPLTAIALMAVFGVPQLTPVIASPEELIRRNPDQLPALSEAPAFGEAPLVTQTPEPPVPRFAWATDGPVSGGQQPTQVTPPVQPVAAAILASQAASQSPATDWRSAARRLSDMGIDRYHLERGSTPEAFLFVCLVAPAGNTQVTHRFEAEASDPLAAVNLVLGQVDQWLQERYARQAFPASSVISSR